MDEISMFTALRPAPPADADAMRAGVRGRVTSVLLDAEAVPGQRSPARRSPAGPRRSAVRRRRFLIGGGLVTAAVAAAIVIPPVLSDGALTAKAWAIERNSDGSITIDVTRQFDDPAGLQAELKAYGIPAFVTMHRMITGANSGGGYAYDECDYLNLDRAPDAVQNAVIAEGPHVNAPSDVVTWGTWILRPAAMPPGSALLIASWRATDGTNSTGTMIPIVLRTDKLPVCTPNTKLPAVGPGQLPSAQVTATVPAGPGSSAQASPYPSASAAG